MTTDASARARADGARSATSAFTSDWTAATAASFTAASTATRAAVPALHVTKAVSSS